LFLRSGRNRCHGGLLLLLLQRSANLPLELLGFSSGNRSNAVVDARVHDGGRANGGGGGGGGGFLLLQHLRLLLHALQLRGVFPLAGTFDQEDGQAHHQDEHHDDDHGDEEEGALFGGSGLTVLGSPAGLRDGAGHRQFVHLVVGMLVH